MLGTLIESCAAKECIEVDKGNLIAGVDRIIEMRENEMIVERGLRNGA